MVKCACGHAKDRHSKDPQAGMPLWCMEMRCECRVYAATSSVWVLREEPLGHWTQNHRGQPIYVAQVGELGEWFCYWYPEPDGKPYVLGRSFDFLEATTEGKASLDELLVGAQ